MTSKGISGTYCSWKKFRRSPVEMVKYPIIYLRASLAPSKRWLVVWDFWTINSILPKWKFGESSTRKFYCLEVFSSKTPPWNVAETPEPEAGSSAPVPSIFPGVNSLFFNFGDVFFCAQEGFSEAKFCHDFWGILCWLAHDSKRNLPRKNDTAMKSHNKNGKVFYLTTTACILIGLRLGITCHMKKPLAVENPEQRSHISVLGTFYCRRQSKKSTSASPWTPSAHEKWRFYTPKIWVITPKNEGCGVPMELNVPLTNRHFQRKFPQKPSRDKPTPSTILQRLISAFSFCQKEELPPGTIPLS